MRKTLLIALATIALGAFALAACGDDDEESSSTEAEATTTSTSSGGGGGTLAVAADPSGSLAYTETELTADAGETTVEFNNPSSTPHNVFIEDDGGTVIAETEVITEDSTTAAASLKPGSYAYYCTVDSHREAGMEGALTVK